ncbi:ComF family protein [Butyrivibrio sp. VCB2006]|uniref:ComF family protein n=1 Tax=Butyrivibrio sp. VCB2006 TaxID=1280679 RepID=UPI00040023BF|nr:ComF family protein [Butyrivibrio sp. VCB2006]
MLQSYKNNVLRLKDKVLDVVYPGHCPICDELLPYVETTDGSISFGRMIHRDCAKKIRYVRGNTCMKCGKPLPGSEQEREYCRDCAKTRHVFDRGFSVFDYRSISGSIYKFKYMGRQEYARFYGKATGRLLGKELRRLGIDAIIPVPMYKPKQIKRGYNQADVYAKSVGRELGIPVYKNVIKRNKNTLPMKKLDARGRRNNLKKAFNIARNDVKFKCILIIDDIYTTGSTIDEIAHEFRIAGVEKIYFLTLAIGQTT